MYIPVAAFVLAMCSSAMIGFGVAILTTMAGRRSHEERWTKLFVEQAELQNRTMKMMREQSK